jgi:hypothetical protein
VDRAVGGEVDHREAQRGDVETVDQIERHPQIVAQQDTDDVGVADRQHLVGAVAAGELLDRLHGAHLRLTQGLPVREPEACRGRHQPAPGLEPRQVRQPAARPGSVVDLDEASLGDRRQPVRVGDDPGRLPATTDR